MEPIIDKLEAVVQRQAELDALMSAPEVATDYERLQTLAKERAGLDQLVGLHREYQAIEGGICDTRALQESERDPEMADLVRAELAELEERRDDLLERIKRELLPTDARDERDVIVEIRGGTGGEEASLFAADLFRMYTRYAQNRRWQVEVIDANESDLGGYKEVVFEVHGRGAYSRLKFESGVHRVQRVPVTEAQGRLHTSTATVAVLPEVEEVDFSINPDDIRVDIFHAGGHGGQNVNKVATAVRLTHVPSGLVVVCRDERSQLKNRQKAMAVLRARLYELQQSKAAAEVSKTRREQVGTADRAEKIRTYNFPQDRLTDHRIGLTVHNLEGILGGDLDELIDAVAAADQARRLEEALA